MRIKEILAESITFHPVVELEDSHGKYWGTDPWKEPKEDDCWQCDGTGKRDGDERSREDCIACGGTAKQTFPVSTAPELNVSNTNGLAIQEMLGLDPDYSGLITHDQLPNLLRKLIKLKNTQEPQQYVEPEKIIPGDRYRYDDNGITKIGRSTNIIHGGRSLSQVHRYIDELIKIIQFAQNHNAALSWG